VFGDVTFAQSPFASLGGATYGVAVAETATGNNTQSLIVTYGGTAAETATATSTQSAQANFVASRYEVATANTKFNTLNNIFLRPILLRLLQKWDWFLSSLLLAN
jgi:Ca2+-binding RTX toxin-like protein